ncbi:MAG: acetyl-CoA carboxylase biotin carboxylase subunit [Aestuariivirgaceae bacterium]
MFKKILIANRGEIACRVTRTARRLGIRTVAIYSDADARALHVDMADEAIAIGPAPAGQSYLVVDRIIEACRSSDAEAVHPGYGFLSERAGFAKALAEAGIVFIGPNPRAIDVMGDKIESKRFAAAAGLSTIPGYLGTIDTQSQALKIAEEIGYPVMIKASAGGGGKGMRIAHSPKETAEGFDRARAEAAASFGDDRVFIEKYVADPRHIEIQVLGDKRGNIVHLGERECSIQRRNQKIIEEAPSPIMDERTRGAMGSQAIALAKAVNYDSAGTVEFVVGQDKTFYFLEMNTRLQVEHAVTELVTGIDLVEQMIRIAAGEPLKLRQEDVRLNGSAIESRIYAEDPFRNFMPSAGRLIKYRPPPEGRTESGATIRNDTGVYEGGEIPVHYDPMIAKLVTHAVDRVGAIDAMSRALDQFLIQGVRHNIPFLSAIMSNARWKSGRLSTRFIDDEFPGGFAGAERDDRLTARLIGVAVSLDFAENERRRKLSGQLGGQVEVRSAKRVVTLDGEWHLAEVDRQKDGLQVTLDGKRTLTIAGRWSPQDLRWTGLIDGQAAVMQVERLGNGFRLFHAGVTLVVHVYSERVARLAKLIPAKTLKDSSKALRCPMPGLVVAVSVSDGQEVKAGDAVAIIEAMKMQNILRAERDGRVKKLLVAPGDSLAVDAVIAEFE